MTSPPHLQALVTEHNPALLAAHGVGPDTAAQLILTAGTNPDRLRSEAAFAALCGAAPVPASSGKITRYRLSRGGDRAANKALHRIALVRSRSHPPTRDYVARQTANGRTKKEICACSNAPSPAKCSNSSPAPAPSTTTATYDPPASQNITVTAVAAHFGSDRSPSPDSNADNTETTHSPPPTDTGSPPRSSTPLDP